MDIQTFAHATPETLQRQVETDLATGLTEAQAAQRLQKFGPNSLETAQQIGWLLQFLLLFKNPLVITLLVAGGVSWTLGDHVSASIIFGMVFLSVVTDFWQERDARNAAERLKNQVKTLATVVREGREQALEPEKLVPGDLILLRPGNIAPADARILAAKSCFVNQSSLTGESFPSEKTAEMPPADAGLNELNNLVFMGSAVISGTARAVVVQTGAATQFGKIASSLVRAPEETDFSRGIRDFGMLILRMTIALVLVIFMANALLKHDFFESFLFAVAVAVGLTPEMLPMIMSVTMAKGSLGMAKKGAVVKKLHAIPNFGSMEVLCTDKTGTLTEDKIHLVKHLDRRGADSEQVFLLAFLNAKFQAGVPDPLDTAILEHESPDTAGWEKVDEIPFDFVRKRESVVLKNAAGQRTLLCKGAPEEIFKICRNPPDERAAGQKICDDLSAEGFRVLAIATRELTAAPEVFSQKDEQNLQLEGYVAFLDPPKPGVGEVIRSLNDIGVEVKIITGDNPLVTQKICRDIGLSVRGLMLGHELEGLSDRALQARARTTTIFARFSPEQKNRVIRSLKPHFRSVGYMGDGINDAPSLRAADVGISVNNATDVAKDAAAIILTQKDLSVLRDGILEGRKTFGNTLKYIFMALSSNFGNMFSVAIAAFFLPFLPMLPIQILVNNFLYDTSQLSIPYDSVDESALRQPQRWDMALVRRFMWIFGLTSSVFDLATFVLLYKVFAVSEAQFRTGWFMESLATQILVVFVIRTQAPFWRSRPSRILTWAMLVCLAVGWWLPFSPAAKWLGFVPPPLDVLGWIVGLVAVYLLMAEAVKRRIYR